LNEANDQNGVALANLTAGPTQPRTALVVGLVLLDIVVVGIPFGRVRLPVEFPSEYDGCETISQQSQNQETPVING
jgi:hypothetical protein